MVAAASTQWGRFETFVYLLNLAHWVILLTYVGLFSGEVSGYHSKMVILGIDPGLERIGYGVIRREGSRMYPMVYGLIVTPRVHLPERMRILHEAVLKLVDEHRPDEVATERLLFTVNKTTAMDVAKALGVVLLATSERGLPWAEYSPPEVKLSVVGVGNAEKKQVQFMVTRLLGLETTPKPDDVADALAVAITHALRSRVPALRS